jgi:NO-binding membrane sensor protein with MHYT domain/nitrogen-specific signal transduction histidine kinase/ActR/RegA family two-component response regulator
MLTGSYNPIFVVLSVVIATMASYTALDLAGRVTAATGTARAGWLVGGATVMGLGIWSMHFVGMLAFHLSTPIAYQLPQMLLSVVVAIAASLLALVVVSRPALGGTTLLPAGVLMGAAISGMHYVGMASMHVVGATLRYDAGIVALSILIAVVASLAALLLAFRFRAVTSARGRLFKALSALLMGVAISGMHYTGMAGAHFHVMSHDAAAPASAVLATGQLGAAVSVGALLMIVLALVGAVIDRSIHSRAAFTAQLSAQTEQIGTQFRASQLLAGRLEETNARLQQSLNEAEEARRQNELSAEALRSSEAQLRQSQKMEAIGNLAGGIAHDFNNLLTVIRLNAEMLLIDLPEERREDYQEVMDSVDRATSLTRQLLAYGRRQLLNPAAVSLNDIVLGTDKMLRRVISEDIEIVCDLTTDAGFALVDRGQIEQVLVNLVVNAKDAMPFGGRLVLETRNVTLFADVANGAPALPAGEYVTLTVCDSGVGMTPEIRDRALEPFFTTKPTGKGSGLGLSMVYGLVRQSSGDLTIESAPGMGTVVRIFLPRVASQGVPVATVALDETAACPATETILLVEDEPLVRRATSRLLQRCGYVVLDAENGEDALNQYLHQLERIDLVLTDLVMPQMGGIELVKRLREQRADMRVLFMSGYSAEALESAVDQMAALIQKPFTAAALTAAVRMALGAAQPA